MDGMGVCRISMGAGERKRSRLDRTGHFQISKQAQLCNRPAVAFSERFERRFAQMYRRIWRENGGLANGRDDLTSKRRAEA
jgi:hypothetical protein